MRVNLRLGHVAVTISALPLARATLVNRYHPNHRDCLQTPQPMTKLEFFFDCSSPWTYLAFENIQPIAAAHGVAIEWRPILVGGLFNTVNPTVYASRAHPPPAVKANYYSKDLKDWATYTGIRIGAPPVFPVNSVKAMRGAFVAMEAGILVAYARAMFAAYWGDLQDISQDDVLRPVIERAGLNAADFFAKINAAKYKDLLRANTEELIARGGFGSPSIFIDETDMYFGNDRLALVDYRLGGKPLRTKPGGLHRAGSAS